MALAVYMIGVCASIYFDIKTIESMIGLSSYLRGIDGLLRVFFLKTQQNTLFID